MNPCMVFTVDCMPSLSGQALAKSRMIEGIEHRIHPTQIETLWRPEPRRQYTGRRRERNHPQHEEENPDTGGRGGLLRRPPPLTSRQSLSVSRLPVSRQIVSAEV